MTAFSIPIEIALEETGLPADQISAESTPQWRSDCQSGHFKIGAGAVRGRKLEMELVGAQISEGEFFGYPPQKWLALLLVDADRVLSSILFKTESLDNFVELQRQYRIKEETLLGKTVLATMQPRVSRARGEGYFAVEFEVTGDGKYAAQIAEFRRQHYHAGLFRLLSGPTGDGDDGGAGKSGGQK